MNAKLFHKPSPEIVDGATYEGQSHADRIRSAVALALRYWPNDGRDDSPREMIRSAFRRLRVSVEKRGYDLGAAAGALETDAYRYSDM